MTSYSGFDVNSIWSTLISFKPLVDGFVLVCTDERGTSEATFDEEGLYLLGESSLTPVDFIRW